MHPGSASSDVQLMYAGQLSPCKSSAAPGQLSCCLRLTRRLQHRHSTTAHSTAARRRMWAAQCGGPASAPPLPAPLRDPGPSFTGPGQVWSGLEWRKTMSELRDPLLLGRDCCLAVLRSLSAADVSTGAACTLAPKTPVVTALAQPSALGSGLLGETDTHSRSAWATPAGCRLVAACGSALPPADPCTPTPTRPIPPPCPHRCWR